MQIEALKQVQPIMVRGTYFRLHSNYRFQREPERFYLNFVESQHTFESQYRFAGRKRLSGFYFGSTTQVVTCEELYFNRVVTPCDSRAESLIAALHAAGTDKLLLKVDLEYPGLCDFTAPWIVKRFLTKGHFKVRQKYEPSLAIEWIKPILTDERGGNEVTNGLGTDAWEADFAGVQFPSVRAVALGKDLGMPFDSEFGRQSLTDWAAFYGKGAEASGQVQALERQLSSEHNIVLFSGQRLIRSISHYSWNDGTGFVDPIENPYHGVSATALENVRLDERRARGLRLEDAVALGLLSDEEIDEAFEPEYFWVSSGRSAQQQHAAGSAARRR